MRRSIIQLSNIILAACLAFMLPGTGANLKAAETLATSYITPFPDGGKYDLLVIGDGFAANASVGLLEAFKANRKMVIHREISYGASLLTNRKSDWLNRLDRVLAKQKYDIAVIMLGLADRRSVKLGGKRHPLDSPTWRATYRQKINALIQKLTKKNIAVYWVGLPIVRGPKSRGDIRVINETIRAQAYSARAKFIDNWLHFANEDGQFAPYGPDVTGKIGLMRTKEGLYFTRKGSVKLGHFIKNYIQRDLIEARAERDVPLFGNEKEQAYLLEKSVLDTTKGIRKRAEIRQKNAALDNRRSKLKYKLNNLQPSEFEAAKHATITLDAAKTRTGKERKIKILRPAIPAAAFSVTRRSRLSAEGAVTTGNILKEPLSEMTGLAITASGQNLITNLSQRRVPLTQTPYYKLLIRGDAQSSKPGRADNFNWSLPPKLEFGQTTGNIVK